MPELKWDETDVIECLEVLPEVDEYETEKQFKISRNGLMLSIFVWPSESVVRLDLYNKNTSDPLIGLALAVRGQIEFIKGKGPEYLRFENVLPVPSRFSYQDVEADIFDPAIIPLGTDVIIRVNPDIRIEFNRRIS